MHKQKIEYISRNGCISIITHSNDNDFPICNSFLPGEFDKAEVFAPDLVAECNKVWTPEVVDAWMRKQAEQEILFNVQKQ